MIEYSRSYGKTFPTPILIGSGSTGLKCHLSNKAPRGKLKNNTDKFIFQYLSYLIKD